MRKRIGLFFCCATVLLAVSPRAMLAQKAGVCVKMSYTMPVGVDPARKIFFSFFGDSGTFTGADLLAAIDPGVEFHAATGSNLQVEQVGLTIDGAIPDCLQPLTACITASFDKARFPGVSAPWQDAMNVPFGVTLQSQPGAASVGQRIFDNGVNNYGLAYGQLELTAEGKRDIEALDPDCLDAFRLLTFRATAIGNTTPEPGALALGFALVCTGSLGWRRRKRSVHQD